MEQVVPGLSSSSEVKSHTNHNRTKKFKLKLPKYKKKSRKDRISQQMIRKKEREQRGKRNADAGKDAGLVKKKARPSKRTFKCTEEVDASILRVLGKTFKPKFKGRLESNGLGHSAVPSTSSSMRLDAHEQRQERKKKKKTNMLGDMLSYQDVANSNFMRSEGKVKNTVWLNYF